MWFTRSSVTNLSVARAPARRVLKIAGQSAGEPGRQERQRKTRYGRTDVRPPHPCVAALMSNRAPPRSPARFLIGRLRNQLRSSRPPHCHPPPSGYEVVISAR